MNIYLLALGFVFALAFSGAAAIWVSNKIGEWVSAMEDKFKPQSGVVEI